MTLEFRGPGPVPLRLRVNGRVEEVFVEPRRTLLSLLREELGLTGAKRGCGEATCGACTVILGGETVYACMTLAIDCEGREVRTIEGLTIERRAEVNKPIPDEVLAELKKCHVILKGPTTTPRKGDPWPNIESANVAMRKELDLFANVRPVKVPEQNIDWIFFRENTEDVYAVGSQGCQVSADLAVDFRVISRPLLRHRRIRRRPPRRRRSPGPR